jgi:uncharacterized phage protein (TIGR02218 family)
VTYDASEKAAFSGKPVECFKFEQGATIWKYTSADSAIVLPEGTFEPEAIRREEEEFSEEDITESVNISMPLDLAVAVAALSGTHQEMIWLTIYRAHRGEEASRIRAFTGRVASVSASGPEGSISEALLSCTSISTDLDRQIPVLAIQNQCNLALYSSACGLDKMFPLWRNPVSLISVVGCIVKATEFTNHDDQYYRGGMLESYTGERRFIADHQGDTVIIMSPMSTLAAGQYAYAYWGCDHDEETCLKKFGNLPNHLGWRHIPGRNPFHGRMD